MMTVLFYAALYLNIGLLVATMFIYSQWTRVKGDFDMMVKKLGDVGIHIGSMGRIGIWIGLTGYTAITWPKTVLWFFLKKRNE